MRQIICISILAGGLLLGMGAAHSAGAGSIWPANLAAMPASAELQSKFFLLAGVCLPVALLAVVSFGSACLRPLAGLVQRRPSPNLPAQHNVPVAESRPVFSETESWLGSLSV